MKKDGMTFTLFLMLLVYTQTVYPQPVKAAFYQNMYAEKPVSILIMPVLKHTNNDFSVGLITALNETILSGKGYYVMPSSIIQPIIIQDSLECLPDINPDPCRVFHDRFGIDALLFIAFKNTPQALSESSPFNELEYSLVSATTGKELWFYDIKVRNEMKSPDMEFPNTGSFCFDMFCGFTGIFFGAMITSAYTYDKNIERASEKALRNLPAGKFLPNYLLDSMDKINVNLAWQNQKFGERIPAE